jgi:glc operon protein GlcG
LYEKKTLGLDEARTIIDAVLSKAGAEAGSPVVVVVVDGDGETIAMARMDGAGHLPRSMAMRKAYTAARMGSDSAAFADRMRTIGFEVANLGDPKLVFANGGVCLRVDRQVVGGVGVSGRTGEEDTELAKAGAASIGL